MWLYLLGCQAPAPTGDETVYTAPDERGPWIAGTEELEFEGPGGATAVQAWFPAASADDDAYRYDDFLEGTAREDAVPDCAAARPVVVFSHGNGGIRYQSIFLAEQLASQGWVVVAPDHVGNTIYDADGATLAELMMRRPRDVAATFDWLAETEADGLLAGCVDPDAGYAVVGHSFGGYTSLAVAGATLDAAASAAWCADAHDEWLCGAFAEASAAAGQTTFDLSDPRAWAAVPLAPAGYEVFLAGLADIAVPTLVMGGTLDVLTPMDTQVTPIYEGLATTPRALGTVEGAGHFSFSDACAMVPTYDDCSPPYLPDEETHPVIATTVTAFLRWAHGDEQAAAWLPDPDATILAWDSAP